MTETHEATPVLIVGGGPVGLTAAILLARQGIPLARHRAANHARHRPEGACAQSAFARNLPLRRHRPRSHRRPKNPGRGKRPRPLRRAPGGRGDRPAALRAPGRSRAPVDANTAHQHCAARLRRHSARKNRDPAARHAQAGRRMAGSQRARRRRRQPRAPGGWINHDDPQRLSARLRWGRQPRARKPRHRHGGRARRPEFAQHSLLGGRAAARRGPAGNPLLDSRSGGLRHFHRLQSLGQFRVRPYLRPRSRAARKLHAGALPFARQRGDRRSHGRNHHSRRQPLGDGGAGRQHLPRRPDISGRRRRASLSANRRARPQHRHRGCAQSGLENRGGPTRRL